MGKNYFLAGLSGLIAALTYSYSNLGFLIFFAFVPLFFVLFKTCHLKPVPCNLFSIGFFAGLVYFLYNFRWFLSLHPLDSLGIENKFLSSILVLLVWLLVSLTMALSWGLFAIFATKFSSICNANLRMHVPTYRGSSISQPNQNLGEIGTNAANRKNFFSYLYAVPCTLYPSALFVLLDYLRSYVIAILGSGSGGLLGPHWTLGSPAYALSNNTLALHLASLVGIYGVTFLIIVVNLLIFIGLTRLAYFQFSINKKIPKVLFSNGREKVVLSIVILVIFASFVVLGLVQRPQQTGDRSVAFVIIQTSQQQAVAGNSPNALASFKREIELLTAAIEKHPEAKLIIFPEGSNFFKNLSTFLTPEQIKKYFIELTKNSKLIVDNSSVSVDSQTSYSRTLFLNTKQDIVGYYDKKLLTPGGEYLPSFIKFLAGVISPKKQSSYQSLVSFSAGQGEKLAEFENIRIRAAACSDFLSPIIIRDQSEDADLLIGLASTAMFHGSRSLIQQNLAINQFRAAENNTPLIFAANDGLSYTLDNRGTITKIASDSSEQLLTGIVVIGATKSWYNKLGDWPILLALIAMLLASSFQFLVSRLKSQKVFARN